MKAPITSMPWTQKVFENLTCGPCRKTCYSCLLPCAVAIYEAYTIVKVCNTTVLGMCLVVLTKVRQSWTCPMAKPSVFVEQA